MAKLPDLIQQIVVDFAEDYSNFGPNPLIGRIVGLLVISPEPQSLDDIFGKVYCRPSLNWISRLVSMWLILDFLYRVASTMSLTSRR